MGTNFKERTGAIALSLMMSLVGCGAEPEAGGDGIAAVTTTFRDAKFCADPQARNELGPFYTTQKHGDWSKQYTNLSGANILVGGGLVVEDFDGDGALDIFLPHGGSSQLFMGHGDGNFSDETPERLPQRDGMRATGASGADYDGDGDIDLLISVLGDGNRLYINDGTGIFNDGTQGSGLLAAGFHSMSSAWGDMDGDGDLDLLIANYAEQKWYMCALLIQDNLPAADPHEFYENLGDGTFEDISNRLPQSVKDGWGLSVGFFDLDADGLQDLYFAHDYGIFRTANTYLHNLGGGNFEDLSRSSGLGLALMNTGVAGGDINGDGLLDLLLPSKGDVALLESTPEGIWERRDQQRLLQMPFEEHNPLTWGGSLLDIDNDGDLDVFISLGDLVAIEGELESENQQDRLWLQNGGGQFTEQSAAYGLHAGGAQRGYVWADLNGDGYLDLVRRNLDQAATIHLARCGDKASLNVELRQPGGNQRAIGAQVILRTPEGSTRRVMGNGRSSFLSSGPHRVHFGLGEGDLPLTLEVIWPDGAVSLVGGVPPGGGGMVVFREG